MPAPRTAPRRFLTLFAGLLIGVVASGPLLASAQNGPPDHAANHAEDREDREAEDDDSGHGRQVRTDRVFGDDRFATSVAISQYEFPGGAPEVYLARADNFADAVSAGSLKKGPVLLVPQCGELPAVVAAELGRLHPHKVVALGGPEAVCDDMLQAAADAAAAGRGHAAEAEATAEEATEEEATEEDAVAGESSLDEPAGDEPSQG